MTGASVCTYFYEQASIEAIGLTRVLSQLRACIKLGAVQTWTRSIWVIDVEGGFGPP